ncbi:aromatic ring-hydroxylating oxygenase subunit alpha [Ottowia testudinis]|uniref:Aromatic ring-hydroxylating dioxygenase subunit alpha n=1 Tax=Ottowia testudinis TaxID=2816950 RepID=A0A975CKC2_9BURK|nr:aromatic ring-hydroxylating dioxygenase subunit alpha [Ottowia testudinis]QTD45779.1 aromatic ring-hydroxylating dioxygenase subunit alpha [Ottowia testudinis]
MAHWYAACRGSDLRAGRPHAFTLLGRPLVAFRGADGQPAVLEDRCAHRHAPLSSGRVCAGELQCPYHGWRYGTHGQVTHVPALGAAPPGVAGVTALQVCEQDGLVWCWPGADAPIGTPRRIATHDQPGFTRFIMKTRFRGSVEACLENFLDCPHATFVHKGWFRSPTAQPVRAVVTTLADGAVAEYFDEPRKRSVIWALFAPRGGAMRHTDRFIAPHTSCVDYEFPSGLAYNITSTCSPVEGDAVEVFTVMSFKFGWLGPLVRLAFEPLSRWIIWQDVGMLDRVAANRARHAALGALPRVQSTAADLLGPHIAAWRAALTRGDAPPAAGQITEATLTL